MGKSRLGTQLALQGALLFVSSDSSRHGEGDRDNLSGAKPHTVTYGYINCPMQVLPRVERDVPGPDESIMSSIDR